MDMAYKKLGKASPLPSPGVDTHGCPNKRNFVNFIRRCYTIERAVCLWSTQDGASILSSNSECVKSTSCRSKLRHIIDSAGTGRRPVSPTEHTRKQHPSHRDLRYRVFWRTLVSCGTRSLKTEHVQSKRMKTLHSFMNLLKSKYLLTVVSGISTAPYMLQLPFWYQRAIFLVTPKTAKGECSKTTCFTMKSKMKTFSKLRALS